MVVSAQSDAVDLVTEQPRITAAAVADEVELLWHGRVGDTYRHPRGMWHVAAPPTFRESGASVRQESPLAGKVTSCATQPFRLCR
jgi:hypothetical protein